jgi:hypothetical protein
MYGTYHMQFHMVIETRYNIIDQYLCPIKYGIRN